MGMPIGQSSRRFADVEQAKLLGGFNDLPPNIEPAAEADYWALIASSQGFLVQSRQPYVDSAAWIQGICAPPSNDSASLTKFISNARLFIADDLTGILVILEYQRPIYEKGVMIRDGTYKPRFYKFAACKHEHVNKTQLGPSYALFACEDCGFWTRVDSSD